MYTVSGTTLCYRLQLSRKVRPTHDTYGYKYFMFDLRSISRGYLL